MVKKCFGQVFIGTKFQKVVRQKMINLLDLNLANDIIEIGFGNLFLTRELINLEQKNLWLFEIDVKLYNNNLPELKNKAKYIYNLDFVEFIKNHELDKNTKFILISNIAFNIFKITMTNLILNRYFNIMQMVILICKSIALSIESEDSAFGKFFSFFYNIKIYSLSSNTKFSTSVKVETCILTISLKDTDELNNINLEDLYSFIKLLFLNKRKKLKHNKNIDANLYKINELRAHQLTKAQILELYKDAKSKSN